MYINNEKYIANLIKTIHISKVINYRKNKIDLIKFTSNNANLNLSSKSLISLQTDVFFSITIQKPFERYNKSLYKPNDNLNGIAVDSKVIVHSVPRVVFSQIIDYLYSYIVNAGERL